MRARRAAALAALLLTSTALSFVVVEVAARWYSPFPERHERLWMLSSPTFKLDIREAVRYVENEIIRAVLLNDDYIVYDVRFRTNDLGFIDHEDYLVPGQSRADAPRYAFVGDSFTAGFHGGTPWVPALRDRARKTNPDLQIYNLGVSGTGFAHFGRLLKSFATDVDFSEIVILAISDDFERPFWRPLTKGDAIRFCQADKTSPDCLATVRPVARIFDRELGQAEILELSVQLREDQPRGPRKLKARLLEHSRIAALLHEYYRRLKLQLGSRDWLNRLADLRDAFPDKKIRFIHLPTRAELKRGSYDLHPEDELAALGIEYFPAMTACSWPEGMFVVDDGHPNALGYNAIARCVSNHLGLAP